MDATPAIESSVQDAATASQRAGRRWALSPEHDGLCHLLLELRRRGLPWSQAAAVLRSSVPDFLTPQRFVAVAVRRGPTRKSKRTSVRLYGLCASTTEEVSLAIPRVAAPAQTTLPRWWEVRSMEYSRDGSTLALGYEDRRSGSAHLHLHCAASDEMLRRYKWPSASLMAVTYSPDGRALAAGILEFAQDSSECCIYLVQASSRSPMKKAAFPDGELSSLCISEDGRHIVALVTHPYAGSCECDILVLNADSLATTFTTRISFDHFGAFPKLAVSPSTDSLWITGGGHSVYRIDPFDPQWGEVRSQRGVCRHLECYPAGGLVAMVFFHTERHNYRVRLFDEVSGAFMASRDLPDTVISIACDPEAQHLILHCRHTYGDEHACLQVLDANSLAALQSLPIDGVVLAFALGISPGLAKGRGRCRDVAALRIDHSIGSC